jgi:hypothetical protein
MACNLVYTLFRLKIERDKDGFDQEQVLNILKTKIKWMDVLDIIIH